MRSQKNLSVILLFVILMMLSGTVTNAETDSSQITPNEIKATELLIGINFTDSERELMLEDLKDNLEGYKAIREVHLENSTPPSLLFNPLPHNFVINSDDISLSLNKKIVVEMPDDINRLAFYSVRELGELIRTRRLTSVELTKLCIDRLKKHDNKLHCVITLTEDLALTQAERADREIAEGNYRGPLHGIPYGAKDLLSVRGYRTTWGAMPFKDQVIDSDATVVRKLKEAGAVLVAKLSLGALAWGDVWYGDTTRSPWNLEKGSSGSSAGPASAVAAGLVPFAIGTETWGSIVSPSTRCGATGLRPTFGRVSRAGAMALSWSMDKIGPICRTVEDCAIVFDAIRGSDGIDMTVIDAAFPYDGIDRETEGIRIGYLKKDFKTDTVFTKQNIATLQKLRELGFKLVEIDLPEIDISGLPIILVAEAAAAFDELTRSNNDDLLVRQIRNAWPNVFRASRLIPAVEYIQANRIRTLLIEEMQKIIIENQIDAYVAPSFEGKNLLLTNLTGHPLVVLPNGFDDNGEPTSVTFVGKLFDEANLLEIADKFQRATTYHKKHPPIFISK